MKKFINKQKIAFFILVLAVTFSSYASSVHAKDKEQVIIIGAGPSGVVSAKSALECGLEPLVLEKADTLGGLWRPSNGLTWKSLRTNISRYTTMFSDFPWPPNSDIFPNQQDVYSYINSYVEKFELKKYIQFGCKVIEVKRKDNIWRVVWKKDKKTFYKDVKYIIIASGIFSKPFIPKIKGINKYKGTILHSKDYKLPESFANQRIVVVGGSFSGIEIAADLYQHAKQVINIVHRPIYILERYVGINSCKLPLDLLFYKRPTQNTSNKPPFIQEKNLRTNQFLNKLCVKQNQISQLRTPSSMSTNPAYVAISDDYLHGVEKEKIIMKLGSIAYLDSKGVVLKDGQRQDTDVIIFCTGYQLDLSFLNKKLQKALYYDPKDKLQPILLHKLTFNHQLTNMAFVGVYRGPYFGIMELQARWANMVFTNKLNTPDQNDMVQSLASEKNIKYQTPRPQFPHGDYVNLAEDLAKEIGVLPSLSEIEKNDKSLYEMPCVNPIIPSHYRIHGFASNPKVAKTIISDMHTFLHNIAP